MNALDMSEVSEYVNQNIDSLHERRLAILSALRVETLVKKNPYLFRAKNVTKASDLIDSGLEAFLSSSEEKQFGDFLEDLAIFICSRTANGHKSSAPGVDLEFTDDDSTTYIISIKSGSNWGNSSQQKKLAMDLRDAVIRLRQSRHTRNVIPTLGICYGKAKTGYTSGGFLKVVGQNFWALISGNRNLYTEIIEPIGYRAKEHNDRYLSEKGRIANLLTGRFIEEYCLADGSIDWEKVVKANSENYDLDRFFSKHE